MNLLPSESILNEKERNDERKAPAHSGPTAPTRTKGTASMKSERARLGTFQNWPVPFISPRLLAGAGFYYTNVEDVVRCAFCDVEIGRWEAGDNPMNDHQRWSNDCPFVRQLDTGNIPLDAREPVELPPAGQDTCGYTGVQFLPDSVPERSEHGLQLKKMGVTPTKGPVYKQYSTLEARLRSFRDWPLSIKQSPRDLSDAGFFYTGKGDQTLCFSCGGGLKDWLEADNPWEQHARWFTKCSYVLINKGHEYVSEVSNRLPAIITAEQGAELRSEPAPAETTTNTSSSAAVAAAPAPAAAAPPKRNHEKTDDARLCKICYAEELGVVFLPCGHIVACVKCAPSLSTCAVCRQPFTATVRAFLS